MRQQTTDTIRPCQELNTGGVQAELCRDLCRPPLSAAITRITSVTSSRPAQRKHNSATSPRSPSQLLHVYCTTLIRPCPHLFGRSQVAMGKQQTTWSQARECYRYSIHYSTLWLWQSACMPVNQHDCQLACKSVASRLRERWLVRL